MTPVDLYCERVAPGLLSEPLNAATNVAILIAAFLAWRFARGSRNLTIGVQLLAALMVSFGIGSSLFHTLASTLTRWLDVLPIAAFVATYAWLYIRKIIGGSAATATLLAGAFIVAAIGARQFPDILNGSIIYAPALVLVTALGLVHLAKAEKERVTLIGAAGVFVTALIFRTIDNSICASFLFGTHFLWHLSTAVALYMAMRAFIANLPQPASLEAR